MKYKLLTLSALFLLAFSACNNSNKKTETSDLKPISGKESFSDSSNSFIRVYDENGKVYIQQSNTYYQLVEAYKRLDKTQVLLKINKTELSVSDSVNKHKLYKISATSIGDRPTVLWNNEFMATDIQFKDNTLFAIHEGGSGEEDYITRYSLFTGKEIFSASYADLVVKIPNVRERRFFGYTSKVAAGNPLKGAGENVIGILNYSSGDGVISSVKLKLKRSPISAQIPAYTPEIVFASAASDISVMEDGKVLGLMKADEKYTEQSLSGFNMEITFYYGEDNEATKIILPVNNDKIDVSAAVYDKDLFELE
jgi:hypothetical protein